jgi:hypothetical protein
LLSELRHLQLRGVNELSEPIAWCWDQAENTGDARFCGIARTLESISEAWDQKIGLPDQTIEELNRVLRQNLPDVIDSALPSVGSDRARWMREQIVQVLGDEDFPV